MTRSAAHAGCAIVLLSACFPGPLPAEVDVAIQNDDGVSDGGSDAAIEVLDSSDVDSSITDPSHQDGASETTSVVDTDERPDSESDVGPSETTDVQSCVVTGVEQCNGLDDNCEAGTDEGFSDLDADGSADCVDPDDDGDGMNDEVDPSPEERYTTDCSALQIVGTELGCSFIALDTPVLYDDGGLSGSSNSPLTLVLMNPGPLRADVEVAPSPARRTFTSVPPLSSTTIEVLPESEPYHGIQPRGILIESSVPISALQVNTAAGAQALDATALLPSHVWGTRYVVASTSRSSPNPPLSGVADPIPFFAVAGLADESILTITPTAAIEAFPGLSEALLPGATGTVSLGRLDALTVQIMLSSPTGTVLGSNEPVLVLAGHTHADAYECCDQVAGHIESEMIPSTLAGTRYLLPPTKPRGHGSQDAWRILALEADTVIVGTGLGLTTLSQAGSATSFSTPDAVLVESLNAKPFVIYQVMTGPRLSLQDASASLGGPAMWPILPRARYARARQVFALEGFETHATVIFLEGTALFVDGDEVFPTASSLGSTGYLFAWVDLEPGLHVIRGQSPIGVSVYGHSESRSYALWAGIGPAAPPSSPPP